MNFQRYKNIIKRFSKISIIELLGKRYNMIKDEFDNEGNSLDKLYLVDILVAYSGFSLLKDKKFRQKYYEHHKLEELQKILNNNESNIESLVSMAVSIDFKQNKFYENYFKNFLNCPDFSFDDLIKEDKQENVCIGEKKFYELMDYQYLIKQQAVYELSRYNPIGRKFLIHMPTGTGKTKTCMHIVTHYLNEINTNGLVIWIAHTNELLTQALETFKQVWSHLGRKNITIEKSWGKGVYKIVNGVIFTTIQTVQALKQEELMDFSNKITLIVYDECHKICAEKTKKAISILMKHIQGKRKDLIGLTATPGRTTEFSIENRDFAEFFQRVIEIDIDTVNKISVAKNDALNLEPIHDIIGYFQDRQILSKLKKECLDFTPTEDVILKIKTELKNYSEEDYSKNFLKEVAFNKVRNNEIINKLKYLHSNKVPTIVFACSVDHAQLLSAYLNLSGIPNVVVFGDMPNSVRKKAIDDFKNPNSDIKIIINFNILTTGFDSVNIGCVFITRPTKSVILYSQMIGRGLRGPKMGGGEECLLLDVKENLEVYNESDAFKHFNQYWRI